MVWMTVSLVTLARLQTYRPIFDVEIVSFTTIDLNQENLKNLAVVPRFSNQLHCSELPVQALVMPGG